MSRFLLFATAGVLGAALVLGTGCDELSARRQIQEAGDLYAEGKYSEAVDKYKAALGKAPHLEIGHHNAALTYLKLFRPGDDDEDNLALADRATEHLQKWLAVNPDDSKIRSLLTRTWLDAERYDAARDYWVKRLEEFPDNREILMMLANIERQAGEYAAAIQWHRDRAEMVDDPDDKVKVLIDIAQLQLSRLRDESVVGAERAAIADVAVGALQEAAEIDPKHVQVQSFLGSIYQLRARAHGASWARNIDLAASRIHLRRWKELRDEQQAAMAPPEEEGDAEGEAPEEGEDSGDGAEDT